MKHCLEICVTWTEELGAVPPPSHSWTAPLVQDMLCDARTGFTEAVVIGPGRAVLFYGRHSMAEALTTDDAIDAAFLLTGAGMWIGKLAYLAADPMTIQEGRRAIAQAISDCIKLRWGEQDIPGWIHWPNNPSGLIPQEVPLWRMHLGMVVLIINCHLIGPQEAENVIDVGETKGTNHLGSPHLPWMVGLRATRVCYKWLPQCCLGLTGQMDPNIPEEVDNIERKELTWR